MTFFNVCSLSASLAELFFAAVMKLTMSYSLYLVAWPDIIGVI